MAAKGPSHPLLPSKEKEPKQQPSSSDDDDEEESEADESLSEEEGQQPGKNNNISIPPPKFDSKSTGQENGSDSESESEAASPSDYKLQPIPKPSVGSTKRTRKESDNSQRSRKKPNTEEKKYVSASAAAASSSPGGGVGGISRLWSNEDEIAVLNGMVDFKNLKGLDPNADMGAFHNYIKAKLEVGFSREQLRTKIRRMKKRFLNAVKKGDNGLDPVFSKPHEVLAFELSKKIWGHAVGNNEGSKNGAGNVIHENAKKDIVKADKIGEHEKAILESEDQDFWSKYPFFSGSFHNMSGNFRSLAMSEAGMSLVKEKLSSIGNVKAKELDDKWKQLLVEETELNYKMLTLMTEQVKMAFDK